MPRSAVAAALLVVAALIASPTHPHVRAEELLADSGFETGVGNWATTHGQLDTVSTPVHAGARAARLESSALQSHEVYRSAAVAAGQPYQLSAWVLLNDSAVERVFLRISWFNASGGLIAQADSPWLTIVGSQYQPLNTGSVVSPLAAVSVRVGVRVQALGPFDLYLDDISFSGALPPPPTSSVTPAPTSAATATPAPTSRTPSPTPRPSVTTVPDEEPKIFDTLTNGGFETLRGDGSLYAWKDVGGDLGTVESPVVEGERALAITSRTSSTKWAYQIVRVQPGEFYDAAGYAWSGVAAETFLRVSWYQTPDGSGPAIDSVDSTAISPPGSKFERLTTGPIQAPIDALTARVRLMLRPGSDLQTTVFYDAITFVPTSARPVPGEAPSSGGQGSGVTGGRSNPGAVSQDDVVVDGASVEQYPLGFANVKPAATAAPAAVSSLSDHFDWLAAMGVVISLGVVSFALFLEWSHRRKGGPSNAA